jgi:alkylated DNA repair protein alkB family protein 6
MPDAIALLKQERQRLKQEKERKQQESSNNQNTIDRVTTLLQESSEGLIKAGNVVTAGESSDLFQLRAVLKTESLKGTQTYENVLIFPEFITSAEETFILQNVYDHQQANWQTVRNRRLQCFGGDPVPGAARAQLPSWLQRVSSFIEQSAVIDYHIDHVLLNEYQQGQGILPHTDGPSYYPKVACLSIGDAKCTMRFQKKLRSEEIGFERPRDLLAITLEPRSLVVFWGTAYMDALHSIDEVRDGRVRISLTMRKILI